MPAPIVRPIEGEQDAFEMVSVGPTTSMRMEKFEKDFIRETGVRVIVGKGGMGQGTMEGCREYKAIHCVFPQAAPLLRLRVWRLLKALIGVISACRKPYGTAGSGSSAR